MIPTPVKRAEFLLVLKINLQGPWRQTLSENSWIIGNVAEVSHLFYSHTIELALASIEFPAQTDFHIVFPFYCPVIWSIFFDKIWQWTNICLPIGTLKGSYWYPFILEIDHGPMHWAAIFTIGKYLHTKIIKLCQTLVLVHNFKVCWNIQIMQNMKNHPWLPPLHRQCWRWWLREWV